MTMAPNKSQALSPISGEGQEQKLKSLCSLRNNVEAFAARNAAERVRGGASPSTLSKIMADLKLSARYFNHQSFHEVDWRLHREIMLLSSVEGLPDVWELIAARLEPFAKSTLEECFPDLASLIHEHVILVESIAAGEPEAAEDAASTHLEGIWHRLAQQYGYSLNATDPLQRTLAYLAYHYGQPLRLTKIAREVAFASPGHLSRLFREHFGVGFQGYLHNLRMEKASEMLTQSELPVGHIARRVGYKDLSHLGQHFKRRFGLSPRAYRNRNAAF